MSRNYKTVPNQKVVVIGKEAPKKDFMQVSNNAWQEACRTLTPSGFKVYLYLMSNAVGYEFALSNAHGRDVLGISEKSFRNAINELIKEKYLILKSGNKYIAYDTPQEEVVEESQEVVETVRKKLPDVVRKNLPDNNSPSGKNCLTGQEKFTGETDNRTDKNQTENQQIGRTVLKDASSKENLKKCGDSIVKSYDREFHF